MNKFKPGDKVVISNYAFNPEHCFNGIRGVLGWVGDIYAEVKIDDDDSIIMVIEREIEHVS